MGLGALASCSPISPFSLFTSLFTPLFFSQEFSNTGLHVKVIVIAVRWAYDFVPEDSCPGGLEVPGIRIDSFVFLMGCTLDCILGGFQRLFLFVHYCITYMI